MSVISKDLANQLAIKATEKTRINRDNLFDEYRELVTQYYESQMPEDVKAAFKKHPEWFYTTNYVQFSGHGFNYESVKTTRNIIANSQSSANLTLNGKISEKISSAKNKYEKVKTAYNVLQNETRQALLTLKTLNNIKKEFPDLAPMLPPPMSNALVVNFDSLKTRLKKQPETKAVSV